MCNEYGVLIGRADLGWREPKIVLEYAGEHHRTSREQFGADIRRHDEMIAQGWIVIRVTSMDTQATIERRLEQAWASRAQAVS